MFIIAYVTGQFNFSTLYLKASSLIRWEPFPAACTSGSVAFHVVGAAHCCYHEWKVLAGVLNGGDAVKAEIYQVAGKRCWPRTPLYKFSSFLSAIKNLLFWSSIIGYAKRHCSYRISWLLPPKFIKCWQRLWASPVNHLNNQIRNDVLHKKDLPPKMHKSINYTKRNLVTELLLHTPPVYTKPPAKGFYLLLTGWPEKRYS